MIAAAAALLVAQEGHPLVGTWHGNWRPDAQTRNDVTFVMNFDGKAISGLINPGPDSMKLHDASLDPDGWKVHFEADGKGTHVVIDGHLEDITSVNRRIVGTWTQGTAKGEFQLTRDN